MTDQEKIEAISKSPEIIEAVKLLISVYEDLELKSHIRLGYNLNEEDGIRQYEITFLAIRNRVHYDTNGDKI